MHWRHWLSLVLLDHKSQWGLVRNGPKRPQPCQRAPFLLTPPSNFAISQSPNHGCPRGHQGNFGPKYLRAAAPRLRVLELRGIDVEIRFSRRECNISDVEPQEHVQRLPNTARDLQANWEMRSRQEIYFRGALHDGRLQKMMVLSKRPTWAKPELRLGSDFRRYCMLKILIGRCSL
jgi:hypothetical protein